MDPEEFILCNKNDVSHNKQILPRDKQYMLTHTVWSKS